MSSAFSLSFSSHIRFCAECHVFSITLAATNFKSHFAPSNFSHDDLSETSMYVAKCINCYANLDGPFRGTSLI